MAKSEFYTLKGYQIKQKRDITEAMEDYLEMIYRKKDSNLSISVKDLSTYLNVKPSSVSKMVGRLQDGGFVLFPKYGTISLTKEGEKKGKYLLWRHHILSRFFKLLNQDSFQLEQVEKIEHFIDPLTLKNMEKWLTKQK